MGEGGKIFLSRVLIEVWEDGGGTTNVNECDLLKLFKMIKSEKKLYMCFLHNEREVQLLRNEIKKLMLWLLKPGDLLSS